MSPSNSAAERRQATQTALADFARLPLAEAAYALLAGLELHGDGVTFVPQNQLGSVPISLKRAVIGAVIGAAE